MDGTEGVEQEVISMLESMAAKGAEAKAAEIEQFKEVRSIEENTAVVGKLEGEIGALGMARSAPLAWRSTSTPRRWARRRRSSRAR